MHLGLSFIPPANDPDGPGRVLLKLEHTGHFIILRDHFGCHAFSSKLLASALDDVTITLFNNRKTEFVVQCFCFTSDRSFSIVFVFCHLDNIFKEKKVFPSSSCACYFMNTV